MPTMSRMWWRMYMKDVMTEEDIIQHIKVCLEIASKDEMMDILDKMMTEEDVKNRFNELMEDRVNETLNED